MRAGWLIVAAFHRRQQGGDFSKPRRCSQQWSGDPARTSLNKTNFSPDLDGRAVEKSRDFWSFGTISSIISLYVDSVYNDNRSGTEGFSGSGQDPLSTQRRGAAVGGSILAAIMAQFLTAINMPRNREEADLFFCSVPPSSKVRNKN